MVDYMDALSQMQTAQVAQWRRPTDGGTWTIVQAVSWKRMTLEDLNEMASAPSNI